MHASKSSALAFASACTLRSRTRVQVSLVRGGDAAQISTPSQRRHKHGHSLAANIPASGPALVPRLYHTKTSERRWLSTHSPRGESPLHKLKTTTTSSLIYVSTSTNPYHNLSLEHYLLTHSPPASHVLFLYTNRPCVVIGRNQNPWVECNLRAILQGLPPLADGKLPHNPTKSQSAQTHRAANETIAKDNSVPIDIVRRRSGGGTVVHGPGNLNYCTITPNDKAFSRRTHAELVVRALRSLQETEGFRARFPDFRSGSVKVNERHDIVMRDPAGGQGEEDNWLKVSGSAFKLTRLRALHHGTLLLSSPYLGAISRLLRNPWKECLRTKGVESVRSPVGNLYDEAGLGEEGREALSQEVVRAVVAEFSGMYGRGADVEAAEIGDRDVRLVEEVQKGLAELESREWKGGQTPRFTFEYTSKEKGKRLEMEFVRGRIESVGVGNGEGKELVTMQLAKADSGDGIGRDIFEWTGSGTWQDGIRAAIQGGTLKQSGHGESAQQMSLGPREHLARLARDVAADEETSKVVSETFPVWLPSK